MKKKKKRKAELKWVVEKYRGSLDWLEEGELHSWVDAGNSPYANPDGIIHEDGTPFDFIEWHRSARWATEETPLSRPTHFDYICSCAESEYSPHSKKEAIEILRHLQHLLASEARDYVGFLKSENLMERYMEYKYCEDLPFV